MALKTKIRLLSITRVTIMALTATVIMAAVGIAYAGDQALTQTGIMWQVIICLFGVLDTILTGIILWLVSNQRETFTRIGILETGEAVRKELCDERHPKK